MSSIFFNPIEVDIEDSLSQLSGLILKYKDEPFKLYCPSIESISDLRTNMIKWLKRMSIVERMHVLTITNKQFVSLIRFMSSQFDRYHPKDFEIFFNEFQQYGVHQKFVFERKDEIVKAEQNLISHLKILSKYTRFDSVTFSEELLNQIDNLFNLFKIIQDGVSYQLTIEDAKKVQRNNNIFYDSTDEEPSRKSLGVWIVDIFKRNLSIQFYNSIHHQHKIGESILQQWKNTMKKFNRFWKNFTTDQRADFIRPKKSSKRNTGFINSSLANLVSQQRYNIRVTQQIFGNVYQSENSQLQIYITKLINCDPNQFYWILTINTISQTYESYSYYQYEIYTFIQQQIIKNDIESTRNRKIKKENSKQFKKLNNIIQIKQLKKQPNVIEIKSQSVKIIEIHHTEVKKQTQKANQIILQNKIIDNKMSGVIFIKNKPNKTKNKKRNQNKCRPSTYKDGLQPQFYQEQFNKSQKSNTISEVTTNPASMQENREIKIQVEKLTKPSIGEVSLNSIYHSIANQSSALDKHRKIIINRIGKILSNLNLSYKLYGSYPCGLMLPSSDIDISIDPTIVHFFYTQFLSYRDKIIRSLEYMKYVLSSIKWISNATVISTASVPVLTLKSYPGIIYEQAPYDNRFNLLKARNKNTTTIPITNIVILIDITIDSFINMTHQINPHLGFEATALMKEWLNLYPQIHRLIIILKQILLTHSLNKSYTGITVIYVGGISSFTLMVLVMSFMKTHKKKQPIIGSSSSLSPHKNSTHKNNTYLLQPLFYGFAEFISMIDEKNYGIDIRNEDQSIFKLPQKSDKVVILSPLNGKNLTQSCFQFENLKILFRKILQMRNSKHFIIEMERLVKVG